MRELMAVLNQPEILVTLAGSGVTVTTAALYGLRKLIQIERRLSIIETVLLNCPACRARLPKPPES